MKTLQKITSALAFCLVLGFGFTQLSTEAKASSCPAAHCSDAYMCLYGIIPIGTCYQNGKQYNIYPLQGCHLTSCYTLADFGAP